MSTILEEAVARAVPFLDGEGADKQILTLLRQVGELEIEAAAQVEGLKMKQQHITLLADRNAALENAIKVISAACFWRSMGFCYWDCVGRAFCDVTGLTGFAKPELGEI